MAAIPKFASEITAQNDANLGTGTLEHFAREWESAFALACRLIVCPENWHMSLRGAGFRFGGAIRDAA
jgi:hypothetical protein